MEITREMRHFVKPEEISEYLCCSICQDVFFDAVRCKCGHTFCSECLQTWLDHSIKTICPICKIRINKKLPPKDFMANSIIGDLLVSCPYNCDWEGKLVKLSAHLNTCPKIAQNNDDKVVDSPEEEDLPALDTPIPDPPTPAKQTTRRKTKKRSLYSRIFGSSSESEIDESSDSTTNEDKVPPNEMEMENNQQSKEITEPTPIEPPPSEPPPTELPPAEPPSMEATLIQPPPIEFTIQEDSNDSFFSSSDMEVDFPPPVIDSQDKQPQMTTEEPPKETNSTEKTSPSKSSFRNDPGLIPIALLPRTDTRSPSPEKPNSEDEQSSSSDSSSSYKYTRRSVFMSEKEIISGSTTRRSPDSSRKGRTHSNRTRSRSRSSSYERREKRHKSSRSSHHHHHHRERPPHQNAVDPLSRATATSIYEATCALAETLHIYRDSPYNPEQIVDCNPLTKNTVRSPVKINSPSVYSLPPEQPARSYPSSEMYDPLKVDYSFSSYRESSSRSNGLSSNKKSYY